MKFQKDKGIGKVYTFAALYAFANIENIKGIEKKPIHVHSANFF